MTPQLLLISGVLALTASTAIAEDRIDRTPPTTLPPRLREESLDRMRQRLDAWRDRIRSARPPEMRFSVPQRPRVPALPQPRDGFDRRFGRDPMPDWTPPPGSVPWDYNGVRYWVVPLCQPRGRS